MKTSLFPILALIAAAGCTTAPGPQLTRSGLDPANFEAKVGQDSTHLYVLHNDLAEVCITNYGGRIVSLVVPDRDGNPTDVVVGLDSVQAYFPANNLTDFGASIGRYANRIKDGRCVVNGDTLSLPRNNFGHCLHGGGELGRLGWQYRVYDAEQTSDTTLTLTMVSPDGDNGFPGKVVAKVNFTLSSPADLRIDYWATTSRTTIINMTNHAYFNLSGATKGLTVDSLQLQLNASAYTPIDSTYIPTGEILAVAGTPMDFTQAHAVGRDINADFEQIHNANGYDHNYVLDTEGSLDAVAATLSSPLTGITMQVRTTEPGVQFYSGNFLDGSINGKGGTPIPARGALCLETQHYPDSPNNPAWPSTILRPGKDYTTTTIYSFSAD